jgi:hypothetical protein
MNREEYNKKIDEYRELIRLEEKKILEIKNKIYQLKSDCEKYENSCNHKNDDGTSAMKNSSYYVTTNVTSSANDWTGEMEDHVEGYTQYSETCKICGYTEED